MIARLDKRIVAATAILALAGQADAQARSSSGEATLKRADSAYLSGDRDKARALYAEVLTQDSSQSRAVFRLAQLEASNARALTLYRRYIVLEPDDPWGHMAEGDLLARMGRWADALVAYDGAHAITPDERDVAIGRARLLERAGRSYEAADELAAWTTANPDDGEAWDLLGRSRMRAGRPLGAASAFEQAVRRNVRGAVGRLDAARAASAPVVAPDLSSLGDSDGNRTTRFGALVEMMPMDGLRVGAGVQHLTISNDVEQVDGMNLVARVAARPSPQVNLTLQGGASRYQVPMADPGTPMPGPGTPMGGPGAPVAGPPQARTATWVPLQAAARLRARVPGRSSTIDLRLEHAPVGFTPQLLANRVSRSEARAMVEVPVGAIRVRGEGRFGRLSAAGEPSNGRTGLEGALVVPLGDRLQPSIQYRAVGFQRASAAGYFAPRRAETAEGGLYLENGDDGSLSLSADLGAGVQRVTMHDGAVGGWTRVFRAWSQAALMLGPSRAWYVEVEAYDSPFALDGVATSGTWRFLSVSSGLRWAVR